MLIPLMAPGRTPSDARRAPSSGTTPGSNAALRLPGSSEPPPYVDGRLVEPETREELVRGRRVRALPAEPEHADPHSLFDRVIGSHATPGFISTDPRTGSR